MEGHLGSNPSLWDLDNLFFLSWDNQMGAHVSGLLSV